MKIFAAAFKRGALKLTWAPRLTLLLVLTLIVFS